MKTEQKKGGWENPWPQDGDQCPECEHGQIETQQFGQGAMLEILAWCIGVNGTKQEDADDSDEDGCGCGWEDTYYPAGLKALENQRIVTK